LELNGYLNISLGELFDFLVEFENSSLKTKNESTSGYDKAPLLSADKLAFGLST
jgi:hypothetical protein